MPKIVISDSNYLDYINPVHDGVRRNCRHGIIRPGDSEAFYRDAGFQPFELSGIPIITNMSEINDRIEELDKNESTTEHLCRDLKIPVLDQGNTNYCHIHAVASCMMVDRSAVSGVVTEYAPESSGGRITNYRNIGGWSSEDLRHVQEHGMNLRHEWPKNLVGSGARRHDNDKLKKSAKDHRVLKAFYCDTRDRELRWRQCYSAILAGIEGIAVGYNWWRHAIMAGRLRRGLTAWKILNSWKASWGENGWGWLEGDRKAKPDDACFIQAMKPWWGTAA